ncbi:hypothetical protein EBT25_05095 [bacterium]|nr:hypothetical protein [bacterium]
MEISIELSCPCRPGFVYKNATSLNVHKKTKSHKAWETTQEVKDVRIQSKYFENEIERLKNKLILKEEIESVLLKRIQDLEVEIQYFKTQLDGVYVA